MNFFSCYFAQIPNPENDKVIQLEGERESVENRKAPVQT